MDILIAGDVVPTSANQDLFAKGDIKDLLGSDLHSIWMDADIRMFNLETPLSDKDSPISKCGPNLIAPLKTATGIKELNPTLLTLANNHIYDHGIEGLKSTEKILQMNNIPFVGVGETLSIASKPYILQHENCKVGVYACAEHEFSIAKESSPGANPFDPLESLDHIQKLRQQCDYVIVLYHGGKEHYRYPSPYLQKVCRKMVEKGANLVVCQHSHCIGSYEDYEESTIVYGQGNFIFNKYDNDFWDNGLLIKVSVNVKVGIEFIPIVKEGSGIRLAKGEIAENILDKFHKRSNEILKDGFIENKYKEFAQENLESYLRKFSAFGRWLSRIDRRLLNGMLIQKKYSKKQLLAIENAIECEAHRELLLAGLKEKNI